MPAGTPSERSYARFTDEHLDRLVKIAAADQARMFLGNPHLDIYCQRLLLVALCQGGAKHYVDGTNGVKDLDVYSFYASVPGVLLHPQRHVVADFGESEFGYRPADLKDRGKFLTGRAVDLLVRTLPVEPDADPVEAVRNWLKTSKNKTPRLLKEKAVVALYPESLRRRVIWPV